MTKQTTSKKIALVTGGTRGIGAAICIELQKKGYIVIANYLFNDSEAKSFAQKNNIQIKQWDVSSFEECEKNIQTIQDEYQQNISILVNNAGITRDSMFHKMEPNKWLDVINVNLLSCFNTCRCVIEAMRNDNFGRIVNISSINALAGSIGQTNYSAAKAGIIGFTKSLALENATKNITANIIAPGHTDTEMLRTIPDKVMNSIINSIPTKKLGHVKSIAKTVSFIIDNESITGSTINVNGGQYLQ